jgi:cell division protein FtsL
MNMNQKQEMMILKQDITRLETEVEKLMIELGDLQQFVYGLSDEEKLEVIDSTEEEESLEEEPLTGFQTLHHP